MKKKLECGCEMAFTGEEAALSMCKLHAGAEVLRDTLIEIRDTVEARAQQHPCMGYHCSTCYPALLSGIAVKALELAGVTP